MLNIHHNNVIVILNNKKKLQKNIIALNINENLFYNYYCQYLKKKYD